MSNYNWNEQEIINSTELTDIEKRMLLAEIRKEKDGLTLLSSDNNQSFESFKKTYKESKIKLKQFFPSSYYFNTELYKLCLTDTPRYIPQTLVTEESLLEYMYEFICSLDDKDIKEQYENIINSPKHLIKINSRDPNNSATEYFHGRCITSSDSNDTYISIYTDGDIRDFGLLAHETGHAIEHKLFKGYDHPLTKYYAIETSSYLFELLMGNYIGNDLNMPTSGSIILANRTNETIDSAWLIKIQSELYKQHKYNIEKINTLMNKLNRSISYVPEDFKHITQYDLVYLSILIDSYLLALEIYFTYIEDKEKGLALYKSILTDEEESLDTLLNKYNINYHNDLRAFENMSNLSNELTKMLSR